MCALRARRILTGAARAIRKLYDLCDIRGLRLSDEGVETGRNRVIPLSRCVLVDQGRSRSAVSESGHQFGGCRSCARCHRAGEVPQVVEANVMRRRGQRRSNERSATCE